MRIQQCMMLMSGNFCFTSVAHRFIQTHIAFSKSEIMSLRLYGASIQASSVFSTV